MWPWLAQMGAGDPRVSWEFLLRPRTGGRTRLVVRARVSRHWLEGERERTAAPERPRFIERVYGVFPHLPLPLLRAVAGFGHRVMQSRQLRGIKRRAEA